MNISNKSKIFVTVSIFLLVGLVLAIFLSFQVMQDAKTSAPSEVNLPQNELKSEKPPSIYDLEIPFSSAPLQSLFPQPEEKIIEKKKAVGTVSNVKTLEQEQAELSAGLQDKQDDSSLIQAPTSSDSLGSPATAGSSDTQESASAEIKVNKLNEEQIRDLQKKGIIIF